MDVPRSILVITHDRALAEALEEALAVWGFEALHAENEAAALEACARRHPSAVLVEQLHDTATQIVSRSLRAALGKDAPPLVIMGREHQTAEALTTSLRTTDTDAIALQVPIALDELRLALERACGDGRRLLH